MSMNQNQEEGKAAIFLASPWEWGSDGSEEKKEWKRVWGEDQGSMSKADWSEMAQPRLPGATVVALTPLEGQRWE